MILALLAFATAAFAAVAPDSSLPTTAVVPFEARGVPEQDAMVLSDRFRSELASCGSHRIVERERMDEILREQGLQQSGCTSTECVVETGRVLGVRRIVAGSVAHLGSTWSVSAREIDVETGEIRRSAVVDVQESVDAVLTKGMRQLARRLVGISDASTGAPGILEQLGFQGLPAVPPPPAPIAADTIAAPETDLDLVPSAPPVGTVPFQFVLAVVPFPSTRSVSGFSINAGWGSIDQLRGIQAGLVNQVDSVQYGVQGGVLNLVGDQRGVQGGVVNSARSSRGIQAGVLNLSGPLHGIQAGVVNVAGDGRALQVGVLNIWKRDGVTRILPIVGGWY